MKLNKPYTYQVLPSGRLGARSGKAKLFYPYRNGPLTGGPFFVVKETVRSRCIPRNTVLQSEMRGLCAGGRDGTMIRLAFFDMDGTLCAPRFYVNGKMVVGMSDEAWLAFCEKNGADTYKFCKPVPAVVEYAEELKKHGAVLYVLSSAQSEAEKAAKVKFTESNCRGMFREVITVAGDDEKLPVMQKIAAEAGILASDVELVEDTYRLVLQATVAGMNATHVSHLYCKRD